MATETTYTTTNPNNGEAVTLVKSGRAVKWATWIDYNDGKGFQQLGFSSAAEEKGAIKAARSTNKYGTRYAATALTAVEPQAEKAPEVKAEEPQAEAQSDDALYAEKFEEGRALGYDHGEAYDYARSHVNRRKAIEREAQERKVAAQEEPQAEAVKSENAIKTLPVGEADSVADDAGRLLYLGNANTHKRPQGFPEVVTLAEVSKGMFGLTFPNGRIVRLRKSTRIYVAPVPADLAEIEERGEAIAAAASVSSVEIAAPAAQDAPQESGEDQEREESPATKRAVKALDAVTVDHEKAQRKARRKGRTERVITDQAAKVAHIESSTYATPEDAENAEWHKSSNSPLVLVHVDPEAKAKAEDAPAAPALLDGPVPPNYLYCLRHPVSENERRYYLRACRRYARFNG